MRLTATFRDRIRSRLSSAVFIVIALGVFVVIMLGLIANEQSSWREERARYQSELQSAGASVIDPAFEVIQYDERLYVRTDRAPIASCEIRCGTLTKLKSGNYAVSLPVGYRWESNVTPLPNQYALIGKLTYWNPEMHGVVTTTSQTVGVSVRLPDALTDIKSDDVREGETVFTSPDFIRQTSRGFVVINNVPVSKERMGTEFGYVFRAQLVRGADGFTVCMPEDYGNPIVDETAPGGIPAVLRTEGCPSE